MKRISWLDEAPFPIGIGSVQAFGGWVMIGAPREYAWIALCAGVGLVMSFSLYLFARRNPGAPPEEEPTPEDRPRLALPPGTRAERAADLRAMSESRITVEEYINRWSGREIIEDVSPKPDCGGIDPKLLKDELSHLIEDSAHRAAASVETTISDYVSAEALTSAPSQFKVGQWVRLRQRVGWVIQKWEGELAEIIGPGHEEGLWDVNTQNDIRTMSKFCLEPAIPKNGEVWGMVYCETHCPSLKGFDPKPCDTTKDWPEDCMARPYLRCGCIRPVNFGRGIEPGFEKRSKDLDRIAASPFRAGQWVRVKPGGRRGGKLVKLLCANHIAGCLNWDFEYWDDKQLRPMVDLLFEVCFEPALPKQGEWWKKVECANTHGGEWIPGTIQWGLGSDEKPSDYFHASAAIACGCFEPLKWGKGIDA